VNRLINKTVYEFRDTGSGGEYKTEYDYIYVSAFTEDEAYEKFEMELGIDPFQVSCDCCGNDFSVMEAYEIETEGKVLYID
jgi:hypothetical protein